MSPNTENSPGTTQSLADAPKDTLQPQVFSAMSYDEILDWCDRPEHIDGPSQHAWDEINAHLGATARSIPELVRELGERRFGHTPRLGDAFCGGGSVPFEAARIGCTSLTVLIKTSYYPPIFNCFVKGVGRWRAAATNLRITCR